MIDFTFFLLAGMTATVLCWSLLIRRRIYQFPFFMAAIYCAFIIPQAIALIQNPGPVPEDAISGYFIIATICLLAGFAGYGIKPSPAIVHKLNIPICEIRLLYCGLFFVAIGYFMNLLIGRIYATGTVGTQWSGSITIAAFFGKLMFPGFAIILFYTLRRPSVQLVILTALACYLPIRIVLLAGRREAAATLILTIALAFYFRRRVLPQRWMVIAAIAVAALAIPAIHHYRYAVQEKDWQHLTRVNVTIGIEEQMEKEHLELRNAAMVYYMAREMGLRNYGLGYWDMMVFRFVPAQIVGIGTKASLMANTVKYPDILHDEYNYEIPNGTTITGVADTFLEFGLFGSLVFVLIAWCFRSLWAAAHRYESPLIQIFYIMLLGPSMRAVTHGTISFLPDLIYNVFFLGLIAFVSRKKVLSRTTGSGVIPLHVRQVQQRARASQAPAQRQSLKPAISR
ncbi:MAG: hypothetical protein RLY93_04750 [Sumerlaeia bacterium]